MGYTRHFPLAAPIKASDWSKIVADAKRVIAIGAERGIQICCGLGVADKAPECSAERISFNGPGDDGHETFWMEPGSTTYNFCKTARKPYDAIVAAVLRCVRDHAPYAVAEGTWSDEGGNDEPLARSIYEEAVG